MEGSSGEGLRSHGVPEGRRHFEEGKLTLGAVSQFGVDMSTRQSLVTKRAESGVPRRRYDLGDLCAGGGGAR